MGEGRIAAGMLTYRPLDSATLTRRLPPGVVAVEVLGKLAGVAATQAQHGEDVAFEYEVRGLSLYSERLREWIASELTGELSPRIGQDVDPWRSPDVCMSR